MSKNKIHDDFRQATLHVKRLKQDKVNLKQPAKRSLKPNFRPTIAPEALPSVSSADKLFYTKHQLPRKLIHKLKKGQYNPEDTIDLHGLTVREAEKILTEFIQECFEANFFCIKVIHGKGRQNFDNPILKNKVNQWLRSKPEVIAFCQASSKDGGLGAVYVLLEESR